MLSGTSLHRFGRVIAAGTWVLTAHLMPARAQSHPAVLSSAAAQALPAKGGSLNIRCKGGARTLADGTRIATAVLIEKPPAPIAGQLTLEVGDEIFAVDGHYFDTAGAMDSYIRAASPGSNVRLDYFSAGRRGEAVSGLFPVAGPGGYVTSNALNTPLIGMGIASIVAGAVVGGSSGHDSAPIARNCPYTNAYNQCQSAGEHEADREEREEQRETDRFNSGGDSD